MIFEKLDARIAVMTVEPSRRSEIRNRCIADCEAQLKPSVGDEQWRVFEDDGSFGCSENSRRCWEWVAEGEREWAIVLQDDVMGCRDLSHAIAMCFRCKPDDVHSMMDWTGWSERAAAEGCRWVASKGNVYGGVCAMKRADAAAMLKWIDECRGGRDVPWPMVADDAVIAAWCWHAKKRVVCSVPAIFQHMEPSGSLIGNNNRNRVCSECIAPWGSIWDIPPMAPGLCMMSPNTRAPRSWVKEEFGV